MKYNDNGTWKEVGFKVGDTLPVGSIIDYDGDTVPAGWRKVDDLVDLVYPVGAIYISTVSTSPATLFGGTWQRIEGQFLLGASSTYAAGSTGGEATHTLTSAEMPSHTHDGLYWGNSGMPFVYTADTSSSSTRVFDLANGGTERYVNYAGTHKLTSASQGGGGAHNNMPPYLAVYMWKRTR